jgi:uncharacterized membrane protein
MDSVTPAGSIDVPLPARPSQPVGAIAATTASAAPRSRIESIDLLRGLIMAIMMLDHTRDFAHFQSFDFDAADPARTDTVLFFTRWITHFCAPVFVFLAGTGAFLQHMRGKSRAELSRFLVARGLWFVAFEVVVLRLVIFMNADYQVLLAFLQVIWAIGWSLVFLAAIVHLPLRAIVVVSIGIIVGHNLLDGVRVTSGGGPGIVLPGALVAIWKILHEPGPIFPFGTPGPAVLVLYPLIPWVAVMSAGYACGGLYKWSERERRQLLFRLGAGLSIGFILLRAVNVYGDPVHWSSQGTTMKTVFSFLALSKYPPSLLYLMMTLGPALMFLAWSERHTQSRLAKVLVTYGKVPLFFYVLQWIVAHGFAILASRLAGKSTDYLFGNLFLSPPPPAGYGFGMPIVYAMWILGLILLYPLCRWFAGVKARRRDWWLSYI